MQQLTLIGGTKERIIADLLAWYETDGRHDLPWRHTRDPYRVLVSELMLQQTQVPRVIPKYRAFLKAFPTVRALAQAPRSDVLRAWQGLGYNSRAIRLHELAKAIDGREFPKTNAELRALPGIGPYTAGAVRIFAFDRPDLSVDVNVRRVLSRLLFAKRAIPTSDRIDALAVRFITDSGRPHDWHSALMDLGSAVCVARNPRCDDCPLRASCKSKGARPDEARSSPKQSKFTGSNRWWRGRILRLIIDGSNDTRELPTRILGRDATPQERAACQAAIAGLVEEGIAKRERTRLALAGG